jgi:hypothetical protein
MTNETLKALLMVALILGIEASLYVRQTQNLQHRISRVASKVLASRRKSR